MKTDDIAPKGIIGPLNGSPKRLSCGVQWPSIESDHHLSSSPECGNTADVPSFTRRTALSAMPFVWDR